MNKKVVKSLMALSLITTVSVAAGDKEKCYGVSKKGKNDCQTKTSSCAGSATKDRQKDAFIAVPKGLCKRLSGGSLKSS